MKTKRNGIAPPAVGTTTLLAVFAVLCMTVFAVLCLSTVQADDRLSQKSADAVAEWYLADAEAEDILSRLRAGEWPDGVSTDGEICTYQVPINETRKLEVAVRLTGEACTVLRWQAVPVDEWIADDTLAVWLGD